MTDRCLKTGSRRAGMMLAIFCVGFASSTFVMGSDQVPQSAKDAADVVLQADGTLAGRFVDEQGRPIDGAVVVISQDQQIVARTTTDTEGVYRCRLPHGGVYRMTAGHQSRDFRVWSAQVAPPGAQSHATIVRTNAVIRGQLGCDATCTGCADCRSGGFGNIGGIVGTAAGVTGIIVGGIALGKANDAEDDVAELRAIVNALSP